MAASGRGPQPARPDPAWRPGTRPPVTRKPLGGLGTTVAEIGRQEPHPPISSTILRFEVAN